MGKVIDANQLATELNHGKQKVVFTNGCFDILHVGHVRYLQEARKLGDVLVVGLNTDKSVKRLKGDERPLQNESDRAEILAALESVNYVTLFDDDTPINLIDLLQPDVLVKGGDWAPQDIVGHDIVSKKGGKVLSLNFVEGRSTTSIFEKLKH